MSDFTYNCRLADRTVTLREMKLPLYKDLVKYLTTNNTTDITKAFDDLIYQLCTSDCSDLTIIEKAKILLTVRAINVQPTLDVVLTCPSTGQTFNASLDLITIIDYLNKINITSKKLTYDDLEIELNIPTTFHYVDIDFISKITFNQIPIDNIKEAFDSLPAKVSKDIKDYIQEVDTSNNQKFISMKSPYADKNIDIPISISQNTIFEFVKLAFRKDLMSIYEMEYIIISKLNLDSAILYNSTYAELNIYVNIFKKELEDRQQAGNQLTNPASRTI